MCKTNLEKLNQLLLPQVKFQKRTENGSQPSTGTGGGPTHSDSPPPHVPPSIIFAGMPESFRQIWEDNPSAFLSLRRREDMVVVNISTHLYTSLASEMALLFLDREEKPRIVSLLVAGSEGLPVGGPGSVGTLPTDGH